MNLPALLHADSESSAVLAAYESLNTLERPALDEDDEFDHYDWVLIRRKGIEFGFVDRVYFEGAVRPLWRSEGLMLCQITYYNDTREGVSPYEGELPHQLTLSDTREVVRAKLAQYEATRHSYLTDRWNIDSYRLVVAYKPGDRGIDSVHLKLPIPPLPESGRQQPTVGAAEWLSLFGYSADAPSLTSKLAPLDIAQRIVEEGDEREVDFLGECGLTLYFEEARRLKLSDGAQGASAKRGRELVFGGVKFFRARDLEARQYTGELPFNLAFDDSPETLFKKIKHRPQKLDDGPTTGRALWHFQQFSLQVLYSTVENHLFRIMLMAPGYWREMDALE